MGAIQQYRDWQQQETANTSQVEEQREKVGVIECSGLPHRNGNLHRDHRGDAGAARDALRQRGSNTLAFPFLHLPLVEPSWQTVAQGAAAKRGFAEQAKGIGQI